MMEHVVWQTPVLIQMTSLHSRILLYQQRHRLTIPQIAELREFSGIAIPQISDRHRKLDTMAKMAELIRLSRLFKVNDLDFIPIKGPILSWRLHHDFTVRYSNDLDILVNRSDLDSCIEILKSDGYRFDSNGAVCDDFPATKNKKKLVLDLKYHKVCIHPQKKIQLEVHWNLVSYPIIARKNFDQLIREQSVPFTFQTEQFTVFTREMDFVYLMIHGALHHWYRLKWLHDIYAYSKDPAIDWQKVKEISICFKADHLVSQALQLADMYWPVPERTRYMNEQNKKKLHPFLISYPVKTISDQNFHPEIVHWRTKEIYELTKYTLMLFPKAIFKNRFIRGMLFNEGDMKTVNLPDRFAFIYFFLRPILLIYRKCCRDRKTGNDRHE